MATKLTNLSLTPKSSETIELFASTTKHLHDSGIAHATGSRPVQNHPPKSSNPVGSGHSTGLALFGIHTGIPVTEVHDPYFV